MWEEKTITINELLENGFDLGLNDYPIFDENYRPILNQRIIEHYRFRQIGFVNPVHFRNRLQNRMFLIMTNKYNKLYEIKQTEFNPLYNVDMTETYTHEVSNENTSNNKSTTENGSSSYYTSKNVTDTEGTSKENNKNSGVAFTSQYPTEDMINDNLENHIFADQGQHNTTNQDVINSNSLNTNSSVDDVTKNSSTVTSNNDNTGNSKTIETYTRKNIGSSAGLPFSIALKQFKDFYDSYELDKQVIDELKDLFYNLW